MNLPGLNLQYPISERILSGEKTVETRLYPLPRAYVNKPMLLIETPGISGGFKARISAIITFGESFQYKSKVEFYQDFARHRVDRKSPFAWKDRPKWGWPILRVELIKQHVPAPKRRGIVFTKVVEIPKESWIQHLSLNELCDRVP